MPRRLRRWARLLMALLGAGAGLIGVLLLIRPPAVEVSRTGNTVRVGQSVLTAASAEPEVFRGDAVLVVHPRPDGTLRAAASTVVAGRPSTGVCVMTRSGQGVDEHCEFHLGERRLTALDHLILGSGAAWRRRYDDGREVTITVHPDAAVVPVPFPIGR